MTLSTMYKLKSRASATASKTDTSRFRPIFDDSSEPYKSPYKLITNKSSMRESFVYVSISSFSAMIQLFKDKTQKLDPLTPQSTQRDLYSGVKEDTFSFRKSVARTCAEIMKTLSMLLALVPLMIASPFLLVIYTVFLSLRFPFCSIPSIAYRLEDGQFNFKDWYQRKFSSWLVATVIGFSIILPIATVATIVTAPLAVPICFVLCFTHLMKDLCKSVIELI